MIYGPHDYQHRVHQYLRRMDDGRPAIVVSDQMARWRWTRDYVENTAAAIALAITSLLPPAEKGTTILIVFGTATCAAALLIFIDLTLASLNAYGHPYQDFPEHARRYSESLETARERALGGRVAIMSRPLDYGLPANLGLLTPIDVAGGCNLFVTREQRAWWSRLIRHGAGGDPVASWDVSPDAVQPSLLNFMTVRAILASPDTGIPADAWNERLAAAGGAGSAGGAIGLGSGSGATNGSWPGSLIRRARYRSTEHGPGRRAST